MKNFSCISIIFLLLFSSGISAQNTISKSITYLVKRKQTREFHFKESYKSRKPNSITTEMTINPMWFAIQSLPDLVDRQNGSTDQVLNAFFANSVALYLLNKEVGLDALLAFWEKEPAKNRESEMHNRIGRMFDTTLINQRMSEEITRLEQTQLPDGSWPWFPGMKGSRYITQLICTGIGRLFDMHIYDRYSDRLNNLGVKAFSYCDNQITNDYNQVLKDSASQKENHLTGDIVTYLYARTFFTIPIPSKSVRPFYTWQMQAWNYSASRSLIEKARLVSSFYRQGDDTIYIKLFRSIDKQLIHSEMGNYWKENSSTEAEKIETQAALLENYNFMRYPAPSTETIEGVKQWLLQWKEPSKWSTNKSTVDAVYALLQNEPDSLIANNFPKITVGNNPMDISTGQGSGYWYHEWKANEITPDLGHIKVQSDSDTTTWVSITMNYDQSGFEPVIKGLKVKKKVLVLESGSNADHWKSLSKNQKLNTGDSLKIVLEIKAKKDMNYIHIKNNVAGITEPNDKTTGYKMINGLSVDKELKDGSIDYYVEHLDNQKHILSYSLIVKAPGEFQNGGVKVENVY